MQQQIYTPVLIAGGGPVGLSLAFDLAWRGVPNMLLESTDGAIHHPKTGHIAIRTMEYCRRWGLAERVRNSGFPEDYRLNVVFCTSLAGHLLSLREYPSTAEEPLPPQSPEKRQRAPQLYFDPILAAAVAERPEAESRYHCELLSFEERGDKVIARARDLVAKSEFEIVADYLVGCDGARSMVRERLGIPMDGDGALSHSVGIYFRSRDLTQRHRMGEAVRYVFVGPQGVWGNLTVVDGNEFWRLTVLGSQDKVDAGTFDADYWVRLCLGSDSIPYTIESLLPWRRSRLVAERYHAGRVLLAGDAVHTMSPTGGFGFNTGICDAVNLSWKLQALLNGWGGPALLDSYDIERRPVGWRNTNAAADNFARLRAVGGAGISAIADDTAEGAAVRLEIGTAITESTRKESESTGIILGYRYEESPINVYDGSPEPFDDPQGYVQSSRPGHRAPHAWLADGRSTLDLFGRDFVLLRLGANPPDASALSAAARACMLPLSVIDLDDAAIAQLYERKLVLVRPDGMCAWRGDALPASPAALLDTVRGMASA